MDSLLRRLAGGLSVVWLALMVAPASPAEAAPTPTPTPQYCASDTKLVPITANPADNQLFGLHYERRGPKLWWRTDNGTEIVEGPTLYNDTGSWKPGSREVVTDGPFQFYESRMPFTVARFCVRQTETSSGGKVMLIALVSVALGVAAAWGLVTGYRDRGPRRG